jgi:hypothetical protein
VAEQDKGVLRIIVELTKNNIPQPFGETSVVTTCDEIQLHFQQWLFKEDGAYYNIP